MKLNNSLVWEGTPCRKHIVACLLFNRKDEALRSAETRVDIVGVGVILAADSQSTSESGYRASLWDP
jgi:hypothetical protein